VGNKGDSGCADVCCRCISGEEIAHCAQVKYCPLLDGLGVGGDCLEEHHRCKRIVVGGGWEAAIKNNVVVRFTANPPLTVRVV
jgi:hypothetical protein